MKKRIKRWSCLLSTALVVSMAAAPMSALADTSAGSPIRINEVESSDAAGGNDWVEIVNTGSEVIDISGYYVTDNKDQERVSGGEITPLPEGTVLSPGAVLVLEETASFDFGLGKADTVNLYDKEGNKIDSFSWTKHAAGTYSRMADGSFTDQEPTKGQGNTGSVPEESESETTAETETESETNTEEQDPSVMVINEVNSAPDDWVELMNTGKSTMDLSGWELRDNSDDHRWKFPENTKVEAGAVFLVKADTAGQIYDSGTWTDGQFDAAIGLGSGDSARLFDANGKEIDTCSWTNHASYEGDQSKASLGRYPDGSGEFTLMPETPGEKNSFFKPNVQKNPAVINEVESKDPSGGPDWIELANPTDQELDISGLVIKDNDDSHAYTIPAGTKIPAKGFWVVKEESGGLPFGLGKGDQVRLFENGRLISSTTWTGHTSPSWGLYPDSNGNEYKSTKKDRKSVV